MKETKEAVMQYHGYGFDRLNMTEAYVKYLQEYVLKIHFNNIRDNGKIVDFGGSNGRTTKLIRDVTTVEIDDKARAYMNEHDIPNFATMDPISDNSLDTIYSSHCLEHVENPLEHLKEFNIKLKDNGKLILVLPYEASGMNIEKYDDNGHLFAWNKTTINTLLRRAGFEVTANEYAALGSSVKILGWPIYTALIKNNIISGMIRLFMLYKCELTGTRYAGEMIIRANKVK